MYDFPDITPLERAIRRLEEGLKRHLKNAHDLQLRDGLILRFKLTYEQGHKTLRRYLKHVAPSPDLVRQLTFPDLVRTANEHGLLLGAWPQWREYRKMRGMTSDTYREAIAVTVVAQIPKFLKEISYLMDRLRERSK